MKVLNLTPHQITVRTAEGDVNFPPSGSVARVTETTHKKPSIGGIPVVEKTYGNVANMPQRGSCDAVLVSQMVLTRYSEVALLASLNKEIPDWGYRILAPDTGPDSVVRDEGGHIVAVRRFTEA